jgi:peptidoglycan/xylan/chitin deacetylase (PgdA/CDA1 family)
MKPKFIITIDTETFRVNGRVLPFATHHYAELPNGAFGVQRIIDTCDQYGAKATFFVDVYMHRHYGESDVATLCQRIDGAGHDVQLHAHTSWMPESHSGLIKEFPLDRQIEIVAEGKQLIHKWTGKAPVGFRAGAYGANLDTMRALKANDFTVDSSYFPFHVNCDLSKQLNNRFLNQTFPLEGLLEIPVTTYWLLKGQNKQKNSKIDVNACSWLELKRVVGILSKSSIQYIILFLHSFSFVRWDQNGENLQPQLRPLRRFELLLKFIREELDGEFVTIADTVKNGVEQAESLPSSDYVPSISPLYMLPRVMNRLMD